MSLTSNLTSGSGYAPTVPQVTFRVLLATQTRLMSVEIGGAVNVYYQSSQHKHG